MMNMLLRIILITGSLSSCLLCVVKIKQAKLKAIHSITWLIGSLMLILMSFFSGAVEWLSSKLGFVAPVNFVFLVIIGFLLVQVFLDHLRINALNEKIKELNHYIALKEHESEKDT